jgi:hypothetical protein
VKIKVLKRRYLFRWVDKFPDKKQAGECDPPEKKNKEIRVKKGMTNVDKVEVTLHEMMHGSGWHIDEGYIAEFSHDVAVALKRLGLIKEDENG